ncbi:hypothetical protein F5B20DRAFT_400765 [Whalleya microplaca]|nr:hypothetical protein F5B20DRAFT_400765 [Whalleya microplaca]
MADPDFSVGSNIGNLLRTIGSWSRPSGRGLFMFRSMVVSSSIAVLLGVASAATFGFLTGSGNLGFVVGSCIGFVSASVQYYRQCLRQALVALEEHPRLIQLHLAYNFPWLGYHRLGPAQLSPEYWRRSLARQGNLVAAWQSASGALDEIHDRKTQLLVDTIVKESVRYKADRVDEIETAKGLIEE